MIRKGALLISLVVVACGGTPSHGPAPSTLTVFAAASLEPPFDEMGTQLKTAQNITIIFNFAGTQTLTSQLEEGAAADVFASADTAHMTAAANAGLVDGTPQVFAHNRLEIAVAKGNPKGIRSLSDLARPGLVVVLADPSVPAGKYAQLALARAAVTVKPASLELQVTSVLTKVALGEADAGIVYVSDVRTNDRVEGVEIPDAQNVVAEYPIAVLKNARNQVGARAFVQLVLSPAGQSILAADGFRGA